MVGQPLSHTASHAKLHQLENVRRDGSYDTIHVFVSTYFQRNIFFPA
jgi:hypothetical protein